MDKKNAAPEDEKLGGELSPEEKAELFRKVQEAAINNKNYDPAVFEQQKKWYGDVHGADDEITEEDCDGCCLADPSW